MTNPLFDLTGKVALVSGGARGIGKATAIALLGCGATVVIADVDVPATEETAQELGEKCTAARLDVTSKAEAAALAALIRKDFGRLDVLVNNAGANTAHRVPIHEFPDDEWDRLINIDLDGVFIMSKTMIPLLREQSSSRIINIASVLGLVPARLQSPFIAAKGGVVNLTKSMALELAPLGILVNAIAPGATATESWKSAFVASGGHSGGRSDNLISHIALGRPGESSEIAAAIAFLACPAASYVTGTVLTVDGGWTAGFLRDW